MKTICFFNNKGGVGKTTTCANLAAHLSVVKEKRVLVIDLDPQSNITHYILGSEIAAELIAPYYDSEIQKTKHTIVDVFDTIDETQNINTDIVPLSDNRFKIDIIPGNPLLSNFEDLLSKRWNDLIDPDDCVLGLKVTNWVNQLIKKFENNYDYAVIDLGPSLGALNRCALLASDYFVTPMSCDIYSLVALKNISTWLIKWTNTYKENLLKISTAKQAKWPVLSVGIVQHIAILEGFVGFTIQSYISKKNADGLRRTTLSYQRIIDNFQPEIEKHLSQFNSSNITNNQALKLGEISHMFGILPLSQYVNAPIIELGSSDGMVGSQYTQAKKYVEDYNHILEGILANIGAQNVG